MSEIRRLRDDDRSGLAGVLLRAAADDAPRAEIRTRTLAAVVVGGAAAGKAAGAGAAGAAGAGPKALIAGGSVVAKWAVVGAVAAGAIGGGAALHAKYAQHARAHEAITADENAERLEPPPVAPAPPPPPSPSPSPSPGPTSTSAPDPAHLVAPPRAPIAPPHTAAPDARRHPTSLADETAALDRAREAAASGQVDRALTLLDRYRADFPGGALEPDALALRIDLLERRGAHDEARREGEAFLAKYPNEPEARRIRSLLARPADP